MAKMIYWGIFIEYPFEGTLENTIQNQHITCGFRVTAPEGIEWGAPAAIIVTGYGCDGRNEGLSVVQPKYYMSEATPHITISVSADGKPVDTKHLTFEPCHYEGVGRWGWYGTDGQVHYN